MDPSRVNDNLAFIKESVLPEIKATRGFLAVRLLINRSTGEGWAGTVSADQASAEVALALADQRRAPAAERGVELGDDRIYEILLVAM
jgi:hypothetical protein